MAPKAKRAKKSTEGHVPQAVQEDASLAELLAPKRSAEGAKALSRRAAEKAERALSAVGPGGVRRRSAAPARLEEVMVGYQQGAEEFTPIRLVARGKELVQGEVFETQSDEIRKEYPQSPIAKALRAKYNWVAETDGGRFTRDPNKMLPAVRKDVAGKWTCDVCGKHCSEQLFVFRAFLRKEHLDPRAERCLDPFVAYISERCGRGLLGQLSEYARFKEEVFGLTTGSTDLDTARAQLEESLRRCSREDRQFLIDELERLAGVGPAGAPKTVEMEAVERLVVGPNPAALLRTAEDAFRALARTLAPRVGARLLACAALQRGLAERATGYLQSVASSLAAGGPLPQAPSPWPLKQAAACIEAVLRAANEGGEAPQLRVELACSWDAKIKAFGPGKADLTIRLGYLQARQALHAFVPSSRLGKEQAALLQQRLERLAGPMQPALNGAEAPSLPGISLRPVVRQMGRAESLGFGWHSADWAEKLKELLGVEVDFTRRPLRLATGCSGAEAPHFALQQLVGEGGFEQLWGSEINENPRRFILKNCACRHLFEDVCYIMEGGGRCARHGGHCSVPSGEVDIFVGGFPCTPYSFCNPKRFKRNCFTEPAAVPFFEMRKFIAERRPRLVVLENVRGLLAPNPETDHPPIDFILRGKNPENPEDCYQGTAPNADWGLSLIEGYGLRWDVLYSYDWGLPQSRPRVYIVMVRDDAGGQAAAERIFEVLTACSGRLPRGSCNDFMFPEGHPRLESVLQQWSEKPAQKATGRRACTKFTEALFRTKRQELGLDAQDRAYSSQRESGWFPHGTEKMVQQLDIIHAIGERQGLDFNFLLADLSQQVSRGAWRDDGNIPTLTTGCHFYSFSRHRLLLGEECLRLNGFPIEQLNLDAHTENERVFLAGNAMSVPVVGAVLFAALVSLDWGEGRTVKARQELPEPVVGPRVDLRKLAADKPAVVMAKLGPVLADDDQEVTEVPADEASKDGGLARRAAVLLALTRELSVEPKREKEKSEKESKEVESKGLVAVMQAASAPDVEEESGAGDGTGWGLRHARLLARLRKEEPLPSSQLQKWLREAVSLLLTMDRVERNESANELQQFVINALQVFRDVDSSELLGLGLEDTVAQICTQLRIAEGKAIFGRLTVQKLQAEVEQGLPPERVQAWVSQAAQLTGPELSSARAQLLVQLARSRRILARALAPLLRAWQRESAEDQELQHVQRGVEVLRKAWSTGEPPEAWVSLKEVYSLSICCTDIAKRCESRKRPKSSQVFRETAQKLQEVFPCRVVLVLRQQLDFAQMMREARTLPQDWVSVQVAWQMCEHLANIMQVDESQLETWQLAQEKLPSLHGLGYELARLRHLGREEAPAADEFLRRLAPAIAVQVHAIERQCGGGEGAAQCRASMGHFCDWAVRRLPELYQVALLAWCSERVAHFSGHLEERLSEWSQHLNGVLKGVQKVLQMEFENQEDLALPPEKQNAMKGHHTEAVKAQVRLQHHVARLTLVENYLSRAGRASALQHAMVRQWLVELLDFSAEGLENQVLASHATYKALDQVLQVPDLKPIVEALKEAPVVIQGWRVSQSRAGLTFYQTSDGRLTRWTLPVAVVDVRTENVVWTPPKTPPQDDGLMTPPAEKGVAELELQEAAAQTAPLMIVPATPALTLRVPATPMVPMATPTTPARCPPPLRCPPPSLAQTAPAPMVAAARPAAHLPPTPPLPPPPPPPAPPAPPARPALPALPTSAPAEARWSRPPETPQMLAPASPDEGVQRPNEPQKPPKRKAAHLQTSPVDPKKSKPAEPEWPDKPRPAEWPDWAERERRSTPVAPTPVQLPDSTVPVVAEFLQQRIPKAFWRNSAQPKAPNPTPQPPKMPPPEHLLQGRLGKP